MINNDMIEKDVYSTEEIRTNEKWIDGKPIYRKMVDIGILKNGVYRIQHNIKMLLLYGLIFQIVFGLL